MEFSESFDAILNWKGPQSSALEQTPDFTPLRKIDENFQEEEDILTQWRRERNRIFYKFFVYICALWYCILILHDSFSRISCIIIYLHAMEQSMLTQYSSLS